jgi:methyl acetate hydrolase
LSLPLLAEPGSAWNYGIGIDWAGKAVEAVSGQKLGVYLRDNILGPLGMHDTAFRIGPAQRRRLSGMHARTPDGLVPMPFEVEQEPEFEMGGGGLYGTAPDYILFLRMLLRDGELAGARILKPDTVATMMQNHIGDLNAGVLKTAMPQYSNDLDVFPGMKAGWGLSFIVNSEAVPGGRSAGSVAWAGLANSYYWLDPAKNVAGVILTQIVPFGDPEVLRLYGDFERAVYGFLLGGDSMDPVEEEPT